MTVPRRSFLFAVAAGALSALARSGSAQGRGGPRVNKDGTYKIDIGGFVDGGGTATVSGNTITVKAEVRDRETRVQGELKATMTITRDRFKGTGTVMGKPAKFIGRLAAPNSTVRGGRISLSCRST